MNTINTHQVQAGLTPLKNVKNIIAIASGKGGVGKSTVTSNLAIALAAQGARVGVLDADIYGPSQPTLFGLRGKLEFQNDQFVPLRAHGIQLMSIGFLIDADAPAVWRGPMVTKALVQMLYDTAWDNLDYLLIDCPPGTGDIQLTMAQKIPLAGAIIITTPQDLALIDARKAASMFQKVNVSVLGIIENMSTHHCSACGHEEPIFGTAGADQLADEFKVMVLGRLPLVMAVRENADAGVPLCVAQPEHNISLVYKKMAETLQMGLNKQKKDYSRLFGKIKIQ